MPEASACEVHVFCEDEGHERFVVAMLDRLAAAYGVEVEVVMLSARGGAGRMMKRLDAYVEDLRRTRPLPDLVVVARDTDTRGLSQTQRDIEDALGEFAAFAILATPEPHVERWLLLDSSAFKAVLGTGCDALSKTQERDRYKRELADAVRAAGVEPLLGGLEYTEDIVAAMDLDRMVTADASLGAFVQDVRRWFRQQA